MRFHGALGMAIVCCVLTACGSTPDDRRAQIYDLQENPTEKNLQKMRERLADEDRDVRATALFALVSLNVPDAGELALAALADDDGFVRATAAKLLGDLGSPGAVPALGERLVQDPDPVARQRCAEALALIGGEAAEQALAPALEDPLKSVRLAAVKGIIELNPAAAFDALARMVATDEEWEIRVNAAQGLGRSGLPEAEPFLEAALEDGNEFVRAAATNALKALGGQEAPSN